MSDRVRGRGGRAGAPPDESAPVAFRDTGGNGPPIVFVPGLAGSAADFARVLSAVAREGFRALAADPPGTGGSAAPKGGDYSIRAQSLRLLAAIRAKGLERPLLVGSSLGGAQGILLALAAPGALRGLVLLDALVYPKRLPFYFPLVSWPFLPAAVVRLLPARRVARWVLATATHPDFAADEALVAELAAAHRTARCRLAILETVRALRAQAARDPQAVSRGLAELSLPVRVVWGESDPAIPLSHGERLAAEIPGATLRVIERCGHLPQIEAPERLAAEVVEFARAIGT